MVKPGKATARKSTGGPSKKATLVAAPTRVLRPRSRSPRGGTPNASTPRAGTPMTTPGTPSLAVPQDLPLLDVTMGEAEVRTDDWCALCTDGGSLLIACDECLAVNCSSCIPALLDVPEEDWADYTYLCVACSSRGKHNAPKVFRGIFKAGAPVYPQGLTITSHNIQPSLKNRLRTPRLLILEFCLRELPEKGSPGQMLYLSLSPNYIREADLHYERVSFDLNNEGAKEVHFDLMSKKVAELKRRNKFDHMVFILYTHSDDTSGALFYTSKSDKEGTPLSTSIETFFAGAIGEDVTAYIRSMAFSSFFLFSCGSVVEVPEAQMGLKKVVKSVRFTEAFAFGTPKLIGHHVTIWMLTYADKVLVSGMKTKECISSLLYSSTIGLHTSILYLENTDKDKPTLSVAKYAWEHESQRPNTHSYPLSCNVCNSIKSWRSTKAVQRESGAAFTIPCVAKVGKVQCSGFYVIPARPPSIPLDSPYLGTWFSYTV